MPISNEFLLDNKVIIVTGGCGLLGSNFCKLIAKFNGIPVILDTEISKSKKIINEIYDLFKIKTFALKCDISKEIEVKKAFQIIKKNIKIILFMDLLIMLLTTRNPKKIRE